MRLDHLLSKEQLAELAFTQALMVQAHFTAECVVVELTGGTLTSSILDVDRLCLVQLRPLIGSSFLLLLRGWGVAAGTDSGGQSRIVGTLLGPEGSNS